MMANQLKQIARDYNVFIFSATQVNSNGMEDNGEFKNEMCIRGSKAIADSNESFWQVIVKIIRGWIAGIPLEPIKLQRKFEIKLNVNVWKLIGLGNQQPSSE